MPDGAKTPLTRGQMFLKRLGDMTLSALGLVCLSPLLLGLSLAVWTVDGGPVLFRQERLTKDGRVFRILKFRTMRGETVTRTGRFLRRTWLDELPQLVNVLRGDMSLVGPRPEMLSDVERSLAVCPDYHERERVRAGMTGLAQLLGRADTPPREKLALDRLYMDHCSPGFDLLLLAQTALLIIAGGNGTE